ncbi:MAG: cohesin domain-containing protein, partial [Acidobacteriota bacterium]
NDFKLVAQPKVRAKEGETTQLLIGEQVPVVSTTFNPQSTVGGNVVPISSTEYRDTGILMSVLPRVHFNGEITLEVQIQVSAVTGTATVASVGDLPVFTTRQVQGSIRLKDGETNVIAGLLQDNDIRNRRGIIGVDNVPGLGDALSDTQSTRDQKDIVISITPHLLRAAEITAEDMNPVYVGTSQAITGGSFPAGGGRGGVSAIGAGGGAAAAAGAGAGARGEPQQEAPPATMALLPAEHVVVPDEEFAVDVTINTVADVFSAGFQLTYDPAVVGYVDYFEGGFLDRDGAEMTMQVTGAGPGILRVGMARMGSDSGVSGGGSLVTLVFRAVGEGETAIEISSAALRAPLGAPLAVQMNAAQVTVRRRE